MTHKIKNVITLSDFKLYVQFSEGVTKLYDLEPLFERIPAFQYLRDNPAEFECVSVDVGGRGIVWNDDLDLSCDELWENGVCSTADVDYKYLTSYHKNNKKCEKDLLAYT